MDQIEKQRIEYLINLKRITSGEVREMTELIRKYVDPKTNVCSHCSAQIKFAQRRLKMWYENKSTTLMVEEPKPKCNTCKKAGRPPGSKNKPKNK